MARRRYTALRGAFVAGFTLTVLQVVTTSRGSGAIAGAFGEVNRLVLRAFDPNVPAIADRRTGDAGAGGGGSAAPAAPASTPAAALLTPAPAAAAAKDPAPRTQTTYPTNGIPFLTFTPGR